MKKCSGIIPQDVFYDLTDKKLNNYEAIAFGLTENQELVCEMKEERGLTKRSRPLTNYDRDILRRCLE